MEKWRRDKDNGDWRDVFRTAVVELSLSIYAS